MQEPESKKIYIVMGVVIALSLVVMVYTTWFGEGDKKEEKNIGMEENMEVQTGRLNKLGLDDIGGIFVEEYPKSFINKIGYRDITGDMYYEVEGQDESREYELTISNEGEILKQEEMDLGFESEFKAKIKGFDLNDIKKIKPIKEIIVDAKKETTGDLESIEVSKKKGRFIVDLEIGGKHIKLDGETKDIIKIGD